MVNRICNRIDDGPPTAAIPGTASRSPAQREASRRNGKWTSTIAERDFQRFDPFRKPDSLWVRAMELSGNGKRPASWEDPAIHLAYDYIRAMDSARSDAKRAHIERRMPDVTAAFQLHVEAGPVRDEIEARLLAGESFGIIAGKVGVAVPVIELYEKLFFNVSGSLRATDWLIEEAVSIYIGMRRPPSRGEIWKYTALAAGPAALDMLVADYFGRDEPRIPDRQLLAQKTRFLVWECTRGFSLPETAEVLEGYEALFRQQQSDGINSPARQELKRLVERLKLFVDLWASAVAGFEAKQRAKKKSKRRRRTADKEETHGRDQDATEDEKTDAKFHAEGSRDFSAEPYG